MDGRVEGEGGEGKNGGWGRKEFRMEEASSVIAALALKYTRFIDGML